MADFELLHRWENLRKANDFFSCGKTFTTKGADGKTTNKSEGTIVWTHENYVPPTYDPNRDTVPENQVRETWDAENLERVNSFRKARRRRRLEKWMEIPGVDQGVIKSFMKEYE